MRLIEISPREHEVAVARVPAGFAVCLRYHDGTTRDVRATTYRWFMSLPAPGLGWGAQVCSWAVPSGVALYKKARDREVWKRAARVIGSGDPGEPMVAYVVHEEQEHHGKAVWVAVEIRKETA